MTTSKQCQKSDLSKGIRYVWIIFSVISLIVFIVLYLPNRDDIFLLVPQCEWHDDSNRQCLLCGMTTAFKLIAQGDYIEASQSNRLSMYLYIILVGNQLILTKYALRKIISVKRI